MAEVVPQPNAGRLPYLLAHAPQLSDLFNEQFTVGEGVTITSMIFRGAPVDSDHGPRVRALVLKEALRRLGSDDCSERHAQALVTFFLPEVHTRAPIVGGWRHALG